MDNQTIQSASANAEALKPTQILLPVGMMNELDQAAKSSGRTSRGAVIRLACTEFLARRRNQLVGSESL